MENEQQAISKGSTYAKFSEKLIFCTPWYAHVGSEKLVFRKILRTY